MKMTEDERNFIDYFVSRYTGHLCALFSEWKAPEALDLSNWSVTSNNCFGIWFKFSPINWDLVCRPDGTIELISSLGTTNVHLTPNLTRKYRSVFPKPFNVTEKESKTLKWFKNLSAEEQKNVKSMYEQIDKIYSSFMKGNQDGERS